MPAEKSAADNDLRRWIKLPEAARGACISMSTVTLFQAGFLSVNFLVTGCEWFTYPPMTSYRVS